MRIFNGTLGACAISSKSDASISLRVKPVVTVADVTAHKLKCSKHLSSGSVNNL